MYRKQKTIYRAKIAKVMDLTIRKGEKIAFLEEEQARTSLRMKEYWKNRKEQIKQRQLCNRSPQMAETNRI